MSSGVVLAAAMVVSSTVIFLAFSRQKILPSPNPTLRSCLSSDEKKRQRKKKKVHFAENVKETSGNGKEYRRKHERKSVEKAAAAAAAAATTRTTVVESICRKDMPANRIALYNGILRDRGHRIQCSY
ncbi:hypothetical protein SLE2022_381880 [Rubroshorea leprosula]